MALKHLEGGLLMPARVSHLHGDLQILRYVSKEVLEPRQIDLEPWRELDEEEAAHRSESREARPDSLDPSLRAVEPALMRQAARGLDRHHEPGREPPAPVREGRVGRPAVVARVQLDRVVS